MTTPRPIDTAAASMLADAGLAGAVLTYAADTAIAAVEDCTRECGVGYNLLHPPLLHSIAAGSTGSTSDFRDPNAERAWHMLLWRTGNDPSSLTVRARVTRAVGAGTLNLHVEELSTLLRRRRLPEACDTVAVGSGESTVSLTSTGVALAAETLYAVCLSFTSTLSATREAWYDSDALDGGGAPTGGTALYSWLPQCAYATTGTWWWDGTTMTAHAETTTPYLIEILQGSVPLTTAVWSSTGKGAAGIAPPGRLGVRQQIAWVPAAGTDVVFVWPPFGEDTHAYRDGLDADDWLIRTALSYVKLHGVEIRETDATWPGYGSGLEPERPATQHAGRYTELTTRHVLEGRGRVWAIAPQPNLSDISLVVDAITPAGTLFGYRRLAHPFRRLSGTYQALFSAPVGTPVTWTEGTSSYVNARYRVSVVYTLLDYRAAVGTLAPLIFRATIASSTGADATTGYVWTEEIPVTAHNRSIASLPTAGAWWGLADSVYFLDVMRFSGEALWNDRMLADVTRASHHGEFFVSDSGGVAAGVDRIITLDVKTASGIDTPYAFLFVHALHVEAVTTLNPDTAVDTTAGGALPP